MEPQGGDRSLRGIACRLLLASLTITAAFIVAPRPLGAAASLSVAPQGGAVGDELTAAGAGFQPGTVSLHVDSVPDVQVAAGIAVAGDGFTARFRIPDIAPGPHTLIACLDNRGSRCADRATASFRVVAPPATTTTTAATTTTTTTTTTATTTAATTTTPPVPNPPTTPTQPAAELATPSTLPPQIAAPVAPPATAAVATTLPLTLVADEAMSSGQQVVLTELSSDPQDWTDDVADFLQSQGIDADDQDGAVAQDTPGAVLSNETGCAIQCITSGVAYAVGTGAHLRVETSVPATIYITVFEGATQLQPGLVSSPSSTTEWGHTWGRLHANSTYTAVVYAVDANDNTDVASGTFTTLVRFANVKVSNFQGQTELPYEHFHLRTWLNAAGIDELSHETGELPDPLVWSYDTGQVVASLVILIEGEMHDHQAPASCLNQASDDLPTAPGESDCSSISGVVDVVLDLDAYPANATSWTEHTISTTLSTPGPFLLGGGEEAPFPFSVQVHVDVWYGPPSLQEPPGS